MRDLTRKIYYGNDADKFSVAEPGTVYIAFDSNKIYTYGITGQIITAVIQSLSDLSDIVSAANIDKFVLMANGTTGYVGRALVEADISDLQTYYLASNPNGYTADQTTIVGIIGTKAEFDTTCSDGDFLYDKTVTVDVATTYNFVIGDANNIVTLNNAAAISAVIPANASVPYPIGTEIPVFNLGVGVATVSITTDTLTTELAGLTIPQNGRRTLTKVAVTSWVLSY